MKFAFVLSCVKLQNLVILGAFNGRDRTGLNIDPSSPNMVVCCCVNGKGLTLFDLRMPLPLDFLYEVMLYIYTVSLIQQVI